MSQDGKVVTPEVHMQEQRRMLDQARNAVRAMWLVEELSSGSVHLTDAIETVQEAINLDLLDYGYSKMCPACRGGTFDDCDQCMGIGLIP